MLQRDSTGCRRGQHLAAHALDVLQGELVGVAADLVQLLLAAVLLGAAANKAPDAPALRQLAPRTPPACRLQIKLSASVDSAAHPQVCTTFHSTLPHHCPPQYFCLQSASYALHVMAVSIMHPACWLHSTRQGEDAPISRICPCGQVTRR